MNIIAIVNKQRLNIVENPAADLKSFKSASPDAAITLSIILTFCELKTPPIQKKRKEYLTIWKMLGMDTYKDSL